MKKLLVFVLLAVAAWYGWNHYGELLTRRPRHDAVIVNRSGRGLERVRLTVGGQTLVRESVAEDASATLPFRVTDDSDFELTWRWAGQELEQHWRGGRVPKGPMVQRHVLTVDPDGDVFYQAENKLGS
jgi:hypothetical protein